MVLVRVEVILAKAMLKIGVETIRTIATGSHLDVAPRKAGTTAWAIESLVEGATHRGHHCGW
jgi:hypothetical protein